MNTFAHGTVIFLADVIVRATAILALTAILAVMSKRATAAFRHMVWTIGMACALSLPILCGVLPSLPMTVAPPPTNESLAPLPSEVHLPVSPRPSPGSDIPVSMTPAHPSPPLDWAAWALVIWAAGVVFTLAQLAQGVILAGQIRRRGLSGAIGPIANIAAEARSQMHLFRSVAVVQASIIDRVTVPLTFGALHPVIILPADVQKWPAERVRAALLHELAHVRRNDFFILMLTHIARAVYWFHPLVWLAEARVRTESETASDDLVLAAGMPSQEYARHLLDVALIAREGRRIAMGTVAMAQTPRIEGRLRTVLDRGINRGGIKKEIALSLSAATIVLVLPIAVLHPINLSQADAIQSVPGGGVVQLVGISRRTSTGVVWWGKDGYTLAQAPPSLKLVSSSFAVLDAQDRKSRVVLFDTRGLPEDANINIVVPSAVISTDISMSDENDSARRPSHIPGSRLLGVTTGWPSTIGTGTVRIGIANTAWTTSCVGFPLGTSTSGILADGKVVPVSFSPPSFIGGDLAYTISDEQTDEASRVVAIDLQGRTIVPNIQSSGSSGTLQTFTVTFPHLKAEDIRQLQFQMRPYNWLEFRNIPLAAEN